MTTMSEILEPIKSNIDPVEWRKELEQVSSRLIWNHKKNDDDWRHRLQQGVAYLQSLGEEFSKMENQMLNVGKVIFDDLQQIEAKEEEINEFFQPQIDEYKKAKSRLKSLEEFRDEHTKKTDDLSKTLNKLSADVDSVKQEINKRGSSITDTAPVVEIRAALQRLKAENKELDVRIGILDYELTQSMARVANPQEKSPVYGTHSDDDYSSVDD